MRRREFITLLGGAAVAWPLPARAQQPGGVRRIGALMTLAADDPEGKARLTAFVQELQLRFPTAVGQISCYAFSWAAFNFQPLPLRHHGSTTR